MGWKPTEHPDKFTFDGGEYHIQDWSTDIKAAWEVVEKLRGKDIYMRMEEFSSGWRVEFAYSDENTLGMSNRKPAPMAICLAALEAVGVGVEGE